MSEETLLSIIIPSIFTFCIGIFITPFITNFLYKHKLWKKKNVQKTIDGKEATLSSKIHNDEKAPVPRLGGLVIWISVIITSLFFYILSIIFNDGNISLLERLDLISRNQTWLPIAALLFGGIIGAIDDLLVVGFFKKNGSYIGGGLSLRLRIFLISLIGAFIAYWFIFKLNLNTINIPILGNIYINPILYFIIIVLTTLAIFSGGVIDGVDGLSGGVMISIFSAYGIIAITQNQYDIAKLCFVIVAGILAFLWFNIPPARFYMSETGIVALSLALSVIVFLVNGLFVLPIIGFLLFITTASVIIQLLSKKIRGKKIFLVAPIHHHFEAIGWPNYKVTMRYWIISFITAMFGILISLL